MFLPHLTPCSLHNLIYINAARQIMHTLCTVSNQLQLKSLLHLDWTEVDDAFLSCSRGALQNEERMVNRTKSNDFYTCPHTCTSSESQRLASAMPIMDVLSRLYAFLLLRNSCEGKQDLRDQH